MRHHHDELGFPSSKTLRARVAVGAALALVLASLLACSGAAGTAAAVAKGGDTAAVAVNSRDDSFVFKLKFTIRQVSGDVVDNKNAAIAYSKCSACQTVAISIQTLLVSGSPTAIIPVNEASSLNESCNQCDTAALAYQFVVGVGTKLKFTAEGRKQIADIRRQLRLLRNSGLTGPEIAAKVNALMTEYEGILATSLTPAGQPAAGHASHGPSATRTQPAAGPASTTPTSTAPADTTTTPATTATTPTRPSGTKPVPATTTTPTATASSPATHVDPAPADTAPTSLATPADSTGTHTGTSEPTTTTSTTSTLTP